MPDARASAPRQTVGALSITGPWRTASGRWRVEATDTVLEESAHKDFSSQGKAMAWLAELITGQQEADPLAQPDAAIKHGKRSNDGNASAFAQLAQSSTLTKRDTRQGPVPDAPRDPVAAPFNLRAVRDVLTDYELDPFAEIAKVLMQKGPLTNRGVPVLDADGQPFMVEQVTGLERAKVLVELAQYVTPKLKAIEMKVEDKRQLTDEQLAQRIGALTAKLAAAASLPAVDPEAAA